MTSQAKKFDTGKVRYTLIPPEALKSVAKVLTMGAVKYGDYNWRSGTGLSVCRTLDAALRHIQDFLSGEDTDEESGEIALSHAICELLFTIDAMYFRPHLDDRPQKRLDKAAVSCHIQHQENKKDE